MKRTKVSKNIIYLVAVILLFVGLFLLLKKSTLHSLSTAVKSGQKNVAAIAFSAGDKVKSLKYTPSEKKEIKTLIDDNMLLETDIKIIKAENEKLKRTATLRSYHDFRGSVICYASVIGANDDGYIAYYIIDHGSKDGISDGDGVITHEGAVGRVFNMTDTTAMVQLITDAKSAVSVRNERSRVSGVLSGVNYNKCSINFIPREEDMTEGDLIVTSGLGRSFPEGVNIGTITDVNKKVDSLSMVVKVIPSVNMMKVEEVLVVRKR